MTYLRGACQSHSFRQSLLQPLAHRKSQQGPDLQGRQTRYIISLHFRKIISCSLLNILMITNFQLNCVHWGRTLKRCEEKVRVERVPIAKFQNRVMAYSGRNRQGGRKGGVGQGKRAMGDGRHLASIEGAPHWGWNYHGGNSCGGNYWKRNYWGGTY